MNEDPKNVEELEEETPEWLKQIQLNSWEAELLISALFLYILFQIPDSIETYRRVHFASGDMLHRILGLFKNALIVLSIGYVVHIITRGIWVANIGLSYVFPKGIDLEKLKLKGKFREELRGSRSLNNSVLALERIASLAYAISFISSALFLSFGMVLLSILFYFELIFQPAMISGSGWLLIPALLGMFLYMLIILLVFIDFLTNGFFRRDPWASRPYYYVMMVFRVITLSFIYNRMLLTMISNLPKRRGHLVPILFVAFLIGFELLGDFVKDNQLDNYYKGIERGMRFGNYESSRHESSQVVVTIQDDIIDEGVLKLFVASLRIFNDIHHQDRSRTNEFVLLPLEERTALLNKLISVTIDSVKLDSILWRPYVHPQALRSGYLTFIGIEQLSNGNHTLEVVLDTASMDEKQVEYILEQDPPIVVQAHIPFYKTK